jgi:PadR family transcriptional regulator PadR
LQQISRDILQIGQGSLYPALHRLERTALIRGRWQITENNRRAKYYELTRAGRGALVAGTDGWRQLTLIITTVLDQG